MLELSDSYTAALAGKNVIQHFNIDIDHNGVIRRFTTAPYDLTYKNNLYSSRGGYLTIEPPKARGEIDRGHFSFQLLDSDNTYRDLFETNGLGSDVKISLVLFDEDTGTVINDNILLFGGRITACIFAMEKVDGGYRPIVKVTCIGPIYKLTARSIRRTISSNQQLFAPGDTFFDQVSLTEDQEFAQW